MHYVMILAFSALLAGGCAGGKVVGAQAAGPSADVPIDFENPDYELMVSAIETVSNATRVQNGRTALDSEPRLRKAASRYARKMVDENFLAHEDPNTADLRTPEQRAAAAGISNPKTSENLADVPGFPVESGEMFYVIDANGPVLSLEPNGPPLPRHTYASFAAMVVEQWMNSPGHRKNLLDENTLQIGVGARMYLQNDVPSFRVVQMFQVYEPAR